MAVVYTQAKSEHSQAWIVFEASLRIAKESRHASAWNKISDTFYKFGKLSLSTQLDVYRPVLALY